MLIYYVHSDVDLHMDYLAKLGHTLISLDFLIVTSMP